MPAGLFFYGCRTMATTAHTACQRPVIAGIPQQYLIAITQIAANGNQKVLETGADLYNTNRPTH
jgi:hypothetical protein